MSLTGLSENTGNKLYRKSLHGRNDSDELDVFEAARYFSGYNEGPATNYSHKVLREDHRCPRMSVDMPMRNQIPNQQSHLVEKQTLKDKKYKQPSSPGGRLASFLNSLFNQTSSKKKKLKSISTQSMKDEDESPGGRRKRRSSISHFRSSSGGGGAAATTTTDTKSLYSSSSSGFRTPPPYAHTPTKNYKDIRSYSDHKQVISLSKLNGNLKPDEKITEKPRKDKVWIDHKYPSEEREFRKVNDGNDSDSSSDLFELQNYDLGIYSSGLPVYETTHMDSIKRGTPISNGTI